MSFAAGYGKTNVDLLFEGMPRLPLEGEEIFTDKFSLIWSTITFTSLFLLVG